MKEFKILAIVVFFTLAMYIGVEPIAHNVMHAHPAPTDYEFSDLDDIGDNGNIAEGKELVTQNCVACHSLSAENIKAPMSDKDSAQAYGVVPPDLGNVGTLYSKKYLANFVKDPVKASHLSHKFKGDKTYPMPGYAWLGDEKISSIVAYLSSISKDLDDKEVFVNACSRCHNMKYADITGIDKVAIGGYLGSIPPDLSMYIRSRGEEYINAFLNHPQVMLPGTAMPRVGLNEKSQEQVIAYLESIGDSHKDERNSMGIYFIGYFLILGLIAYLWKRKVWSEFH
ncbi:ubiquinol cytochrome C oxidoreductase, cytochrome C1 subunit [hydrothermal vent metagenome]|uniref:Ubiquinol cytochrome C oxidoreductase, cytochrome C1 subunit n=1 Tax=hydrothermal vent metagenome TaxID=652676 RepID=A0A3B1DRP6_9ZZZZ